MVQHVMTPVAAAALVCLLSAIVANTQPLAQSGPDELSLQDPLPYLLVQRLLEARLNQGARPVSPEAALANDLIKLANAAASNVAFHTLDVPASSVKTYCHVNNHRQCRAACLHLGDSACIDGNLAHNGNDNAFLQGGFHPGK